jgi:hypothetical protein
MEAVWNFSAQQLGLPSYDVIVVEGGPIAWVRCLLKYGSRKEKRKKIGMLFTFWWFIWKARNNKIFRDEDISPHQLSRLIIEEISLQQSVFSPG